VIDEAIAAQNMTLAAPQMDRVEKQRALFGLLKEIVPHSILAFGYPAEPDNTERDLFEADRVHYETW